MSTAMGAPGGVERRALRGLSLVPQSLPAKAVKSSSEAVTVRLVHDVFVEHGNRRQLANLLDRQVAISQQVKRPFCLLLIELVEINPTIQNIPTVVSPVYGEAVLNVVAKIFRTHVRPSDFLVRTKDRTIGIVLLDTDESGARVVYQRLESAISRKLFFGKGAVEVSARYAVSAQFDGFGSAGASLISTAELALEKAKAISETTLVVASPLTGPQTFKSSLPPLLDMSPGGPQ